MDLSIDDEFIYNEYVKQLLGKCVFAFSDKFPTIQLNHNDSHCLFRLYYLHNCKFHLYFNLDVSKYFKANQSFSEETLLEIVKYGAIHTFPNQNTIHFVAKQTYHLFYRKETKIHYFSGEDSVKAREILQISLNTFYC